MSSSTEGKQEFTIETPSGPIQATTESVEPVEQKFFLLSEEKLKAIAEWEKKAGDFVHAYLGQNSRASLQTCDEAFSAWQREEERRYSGPEVISYLGAFLGQECVRKLDMQWMTVVDEYGEDYAVHYTKGEVVGYPLSTVAKRIEAETHIFMVPVFYAIKKKIETGDYRKIGD